MTTYYKVTDTDGSSMHGGTGKWTKGRWRSVMGELAPCEHGLHLCREQDLMTWLGPVIWEAEVHPDSAIVEVEDKVVVSKARVVRRLDAWNERTARHFAADCAEHVVHLCGDDPRPREAIAVARRYADGLATEEERSAAGSAAWSAARSAARSAAGSAAGSAAWSAAGSAAGSAAESAAWSAAGSAELGWQRQRLMEYLKGERP